jgi:hypothetical protein
VSRLDYAPKLKEIKVTDIKKGIGVFTPKPEKPVSFSALKETLKKAGYTLASADLEVVGTLAREDKAAFLVVAASGQRFALEGSNIDQALAGLDVGSSIEVTGDWKTGGEGTSSLEVITPRAAKMVTAAPPPKTEGFRSAPYSPVRFLKANVIAAESDGFATSVFSRNWTSRHDPTVVGLPKSSPETAAPIRVTSPGLTVYKGGAVVPRLYFIKQHLGDLDVNRQIFDLSFSYTPSPRLQLELEVPVSHTSFDDGPTSGSGGGLGNITLWTKYRFFRKVKTYGDRQASARFGLELPTGKKDAPTATQVNAPAFVRQQLTPISGGLSPHFDVSFSQAGGRFIFGGNAEAIWRGERDGFRMGHEIRLNTDAEYVLLPRNYDVPGGELFVILETTFVHRGRGHINGVSVSGSTSTEYYLAPGLQYAAAPRFVVEGSYQFPLIRNTGPLALRTDRNVLLGVRYLF